MVDEKNQNKPTESENAKEIEIELYDSWPRYTAIPIPDGEREFFPGYKEPFILETDIGQIETHVASGPKGTRKGHPTAGEYFTKNIYKWQREHPEIKGGDIVIVKKLKGKRYRLKMPK